mgnify:CR=1 FL=1
MHDPCVPLNESILALKNFQKQGLIRYWGVGNLSCDEVKEHLHNEHYIPHQVWFNPLRRVHEHVLKVVLIPVEIGILTCFFIPNHSIMQEAAANIHPVQCLSETRTSLASL